MHEYTAQTYLDPRSPDIVFCTITVWGGKAVACSYGANARRVGPSRRLPRTITTSPSR